MKRTVIILALAMMFFAVSAANASVEVTIFGQPFAEQAKAFSANLISGKTVSIVEKEKAPLRPKCCQDLWGWAGCVRGTPEGRTCHSLQEVQLAYPFYWLTIFEEILKCDQKL